MTRELKPYRVLLHKSSTEHVMAKDEEEACDLAQDQADDKDENRTWELVDCRPGVKHDHPS